MDIGTPDGNPGFIPDENYVVINLGSPIVVNEFQDGNYDLVIYELLVGTDRIHMDNLVISISNDGINFYEIFNWWDNAPNTNTGISQHPISPSAEIDNYIIYITDLYGPTFQTGILVDLEDAPSNPPANDYWYIAIQVPPGGSNDGSGIDAIEIIEIPIP